MKLGILTLPFNNNYGGYLQAYALSEFLKRRGHDVLIIHRINNRPTTLRELKQLLIKRAQRFFVLKDLSEFEKSRFQYTTVIQSDEDFKLLKKYKFDGIIVGSDQVWRFDYTTNRKFNYFLDFADDECLKISFAASLGIADWKLNEKETKKIEYLLRRFNLITVRENSGSEILFKNTGIYATTVLDPTFLLNAKSYCKLFNIRSAAESNHEEYIAAYLLDRTKEKEDVLNSISSKYSLPIVYIGKNREYCFYKYDSVESWLWNIYHSKYVVTDSFHGVVFSIIFRKNFYCLFNKNRGNARFDSINKTFNIKDYGDASFIALNNDSVSHIIDSNSRRVDELLNGVGI